jgi:hypothetical protein
MEQAESHWSAQLDQRLAEETEIHANRVVFHTAEEMRELRAWAHS